MKSLAICCLLVLLAFPAMALEPNLVKDVVPGPGSSNPRSFVTLGDAVLFFGAGLWRSDGTEGGTWQLYDRALEPVNATGRLLFFLDDNRALWVTDGTVAGTFQLTPPGVSLQWQGLAALSRWVPSQGALYFVAQDTDHGYELWRTDGTAAGTLLLADIVPGFLGSAVEWLTEYRGQVWFFANDLQHGFGLWRTDGTPAGTVLAIDLPGLPPFTDSRPIGVVGGRLAFFAPDARGDLQLWTSDGTAEGTRTITHLAGNQGHETVHETGVRGGRLYFVAEDKGGQELWASDGTARGTRRLTRFANPNALSVTPDNFFPLQREGVLKGRLLFWANDGPHGTEPWITDGSRQGTRLLGDLCPGPCSSFIDPWYVLGGRLYFTRQQEGRELWSTDGTPAGTRLVSGRCPGNCPFDLYAPFVVGNRLLFVARDAEHGEEIWSTDGTGKGIVRVTDFEPPFLWEQDGFHGAVLDGELLFGADDGLHGTELWEIEP